MIRSYTTEANNVSAFGQEVSQQCVYYIIIVVGLTVERGGSSYLYWLKHIAAQNYDVVVVECVHQDWVVCIFYKKISIFEYTEKKNKPS